MSDEPSAWMWRRDGEGWSLVQGLTIRFWVSDEMFDETGNKIREKIAALLNGDEGR